MTTKGGEDKEEKTHRIIRQFSQLSLLLPLPQPIQALLKLPLLNRHRPCLLPLLDLLLPNLTGEAATEEVLEDAVDFELGGGVGTGEEELVAEVGEFGTDEGFEGDIRGGRGGRGHVGSADAV